MPERTKLRAPIVRKYNPLTVEELGRNAARALMDYPPADLPPPESFAGSGVYTLHYSGRFAAYADIADPEPIYVGKSSPPGGRQGRQATQVSLPTLYRRLLKHARSIDSVENLDLKDFSCRWLILDSVWVGLTEQVLIAQCQPIWNVIVEGFGINAPGSGRTNQVKSKWDTLHPGRPEVAKLAER